MRLARIGLLDEPVNAAEDSSADLFDDAVLLAVRTFQQSRGLTVDGSVGPATFRLLEEARWSLGDRVLAYAVGHPVAGDDVRHLQRRLADLGFNLSRVDGVFGSETDAALRQFQRSVGLASDGVCGPAVFKALARLARTITGGTAEALRERIAWEDSRTGVGDKVVVIDPGHGGPDGGVFTDDDLDEATVTADIAARVEGRLAALGVAVLMTRGRGQSAVLDDASRAEFANSNGAHLVMSLHVDAAPSPRPSGCATYFYGHQGGPGIPAARSPLGARLADIVQEEVVSRTDLRDCRTHAKTWELLRLTSMPTVRVELGYLSHEGDRRRLADPRFRDTAAEALAAAVVRFFAPPRPEAGSED